MLSIWPVTWIALSGLSSFLRSVVTFSISLATLPRSRSWVLA
jgi:hypothetical protein